MMVRLALQSVDMDSPYYLSWVGALDISSENILNKSGQQFSLCELAGLNDLLRLRFQIPQLVPCLTPQVGEVPLRYDYGADP